jgi:carbon-monoxide dehydrogenase medium subunit
VLAGGTDLIVQIREHRRDLDLVVDIKRIPEANELRYDPKQGLTIGAAAPCYRIYEDKKIAGAYPGLIDAVALIGGIQIQSRASVGGNLCNASPAADTIPALIAHQAVCIIAGPKSRREIPVEEFCTGPGRTVLGPGELLLSLRLPPPTRLFGAAYLRFIPRNEMDIAVVGAGVSVTLDASRAHCTAARVALAAVAPTPLLVAAAGKTLVDGALNDALIDKAATAAQQAARPISDMRGDADYRRHLVKVLVKRALHQAIGRARES